jgi:hypothetical protein
MIRPLRRRHRQVTATLFAIVALMLMLAWSRSSPSARVESLPSVLLDWH